MWQLGTESFTCVLLDREKIMLLAFRMANSSEMICFIFVCMMWLMYFGRKYLTDNPDVKSAAKKAAASKAIGIIGKWLK